MNIRNMMLNFSFIVMVSSAHAQDSSINTKLDKQNSGLFSYLTTDTQALGVLTWIGFLATIIGLWVAIWQIIKTRNSADAASQAVKGFYRGVMGREQLVELNTALANIENSKSAMSKNGYEAALIYMSLTKTSLIQARQLAGDDNDAKTLYASLLVQMNTIHETVSGYLDPNALEKENMPIIIKLNKITDPLQEQAAKLRYTYSPSEEEK